ncbi:MAG TPA: inorganic phosphate transporter [bacterium]|nr:inorganic phosphate transporter [bacterium]
MSGAVAAYSLGANNCGNATGFFYQPESKSILLNNLNILALIGGISIALGALTYSKKVMLTVGEGITQLDPMSSLITVFSQGITVWIFAIVGVPVSTSQAVVGAVMGIGFVKGMKSVNFKKLFQIFLGWFSTPLSSGIVAFIISKIFS